MAKVTYRLFGYPIASKNVGNGKWEVAGSILISLLFAILALGLSYLFIAGAWWVVCWCFDLSIWSWKTTFGVWIACLLINQFNNMGDK